MAPKELNFITGNKHKLAEVQAILASTPVKLRSQSIDLPEVQGDIEEISIDKAKRAAEIVRTAHDGQKLEGALIDSLTFAIGTRPRTGRRYMSRLQCVGRAAWPLRVRFCHPTALPSLRSSAVLGIGRAGQARAIADVHHLENGSSNPSAFKTSTSSSRDSKTSLRKRSAHSLTVRARGRLWRFFKDGRM